MSRRPDHADQPLATTKSTGHQAGHRTLGRARRARHAALLRPAAATGRANQVSSAGAPAAPARASGVQAKKKTMSEPVK